MSKKLDPAIESNLNAGTALSLAARVKSRHAIEGFNEKGLSAMHIVLGQENGKVLLLMLFGMTLEEKDAQGRSAISYAARRAESPINRDRIKQARILRTLFQQKGMYGVNLLEGWIKDQKSALFFWRFLEAQHIRFGMKQAVMCELCEEHIRPFITAHSHAEHLKTLRRAAHNIDMHL